MTKKEIRSYQKELRDKLTGEEQQNLSNSIRQRLFESKEYLDCKRLFTFVSFRSEVDTIQIIQNALMDGKSVYIPKVEDDILEFYEIKSMNHLHPSKFGVLEPVGEEEYRYIPVQDNRQDNLILLPGLAFDSLGNRIGYGGGFYDKYLSSHPEAEFYKVALAYDFQLMDKIPSEKFDRKADAVLTPSQRIICN